MSREERLLIYVNPDDFIGNPRHFTAERHPRACRWSLYLVEPTLAEAKGPVNYYIVCGVQGSGKRHWVKNNPSRFVEPAIVFDAALARAQDRAGAVAQARRFSCRLVCIWIFCALDVALAQNRARPPDQVVREEVVRLVFNNFEPPTVEEGFDEVLKIEAVVD